MLLLLMKLLIFLLYYDVAVEITVADAVVADVNAVGFVVHSILEAVDSVVLVLLILLFQWSCCC